MPSEDTLIAAMVKEFITFHGRHTAFSEKEGTKGFA